MTHIKFTAFHDNHRGERCVDPVVFAQSEESFRKILFVIFNRSPMNAHPSYHPELELKGFWEGGHSAGSIQEGKRRLQAARCSMPFENRPEG